MSESTEQIESLTRDLPDAEGAQLFFARLATEHPLAAKKLQRDAGLLSDVLALAAWSPLLATTLAQHPDYLQWLARERMHDARVKTREEFSESLARFALTNSQLDPQILLARFRRRELLRLYLRDIRRTTTLVETTGELSNLADAVLAHALNLARQELDNRYGSPQRTDERGRASIASFCIVALGKLGSHELNYASDIDLLFLYSDDGRTSGKGTRGETSNREYFIKLAETVTRTVGQPSGEGAAYRVDLRLRPHGRDGALACSLEEAVRYYRETAQAWELQTLIRARAAAGVASLYARFAERLRHRVYRTDETVPRALAGVRLAKQKIDRHHAQDAGGFNVKLGRGGIREIEFIAQALQLAHGGRDEWLRAPHTLISLGRLTDRHLITERERTQLSDGYGFLRVLEHRLQMEHGLQTHSLPDEAARRALVARRMNFAGPHALEQFNRALEIYTTNVRAVYERVFGGADEAEASGDSFSSETDSMRQRFEQPVDAGTSATNSAASIFAGRLINNEQQDGGTIVWETIRAVTIEGVARMLRAAASESLNERRALLLAARIASSLDRSAAEVELTKATLDALVHLCGASEFFGEMLAANPSLINALPRGERETVERDYGALLIASVENETSFRAELSCLRRAWAKLLVETGALDAAGAIYMRESNRRQTELAAASLDAACLIARRELERRFGATQTPPRLAVLGLGRLGGGGMDYGSDLDVVLVYDDDAPSPVAQLAPAAAYGLFAELLVTALSSVTRDGLLYRVDLRLRPDGKNGATCLGARAFTNYLAERAAAWEWLAYIKLRAAAGDLELGARVETEARRIIHENAQQGDKESLRRETRRVRERLEHEKSKRRSMGAGIDIKYAPGGMLDVYFATRYLQLRDRVPDIIDARSTRAVLESLRAKGALNEQDFAAMNEGYAYLRALDHQLRLMLGRSARLPANDHPALRDIARKLNFASAAALTKSLAAHMANIRAAYDRITGYGE